LVRVILPIIGAAVALAIGVVGWFIRRDYERSGKRMDKMEVKLDDVQAKITGLMTTAATIEVRLPKDLAERLARIEERIDGSAKDTIRQLNERIPADLEDTLQALQQRIPVDLLDTLRSVREQLSKAQDSGKAEKAAGD
jgi:uncharacterized protein YoxC